LGGPHKELWIAVVILDERHDRVNELLDAAKGTTPNSFARDFPEPAFDEVQPRATRWCEVHVKATMSCQPRLHLWVFVGRVVVNNHVDVEVLRSLPVDKPQKLDPLLVPVLRQAGCDQSPLGHFNRRETALSFHSVWSRASSCRSAQDRLAGSSGCGRSPESGFFIRAEHESMFGGLRYSPTPSVSFSTNWGSLLNLNMRLRCGFSSFALHTRWTLDVEQFKCLARVRVLQCVA